MHMPLYDLDVRQSFAQALSISAAQKHAKNQISAGATDKLVAALASTSSAHSFRTWLSRMPNAVIPYWVPIRLLDTSSGKSEQTWVPVRLPWEVMHLAFDSYHAMFYKSFVGPDPTDVRAYWQHASTLEWFQLHPLRHSPELWSHSIPIKWHSDGVKIFKSSGGAME